MNAASIAQAKDHLTRLVRQAEQGEPARITRRGKPVAVLVSAASISGGTRARSGGISGT